MLTRKTPLKAKTPLKQYHSLQNRTKLTTKATMRPTTKPKARSKPRRAIPRSRYYSVFTSDLKQCYISHDTNSVHIHHIFGASNKIHSEQYGFLIPLRADWHDMSDYGVHFNKVLDLKLKRMCEDYWLSHYGTKDEFIKTFGMWW